jgi:hypothetical protein
MDAEIRLYVVSARQTERASARERERLAERRLEPAIGSPIERAQGPLLRGPEPRPLPAAGEAR